MNSPWILLSEAYRLVETFEGSSAAERLTEALRRGEIKARAETWYSISGMSLEARGEEQRLVEIPTEFWGRAFIVWDEDPHSSTANSARAKPSMGSRIPGSQLDHSQWYDASGIHFWRDDISRLWPSIELFDRPSDAPARHGKPKPAPRRRGPQATTRQRVVEEMKKLPIAELRAMKELAMEMEFRAARDTCRKARNEVLSEFDT